MTEQTQYQLGVHKTISEKLNGAFPTCRHCNQTLTVRPEITWIQSWQMGIPHSVMQAHAILECPNCAYTELFEMDGLFEEKWRAAYLSDLDG